MNVIIRLTGSDLTLEQVALVARQGAVVEIAPEAEERIRRTRSMVLSMAEDRSLPRIYGFNTGVGMNKDWDISREGLAAFNTMLIRSHSAAVGPELCEADVRATLLVRLNCLLADGTGVSWELVERYRDFLNLHMHPVMPGRGSIGEADLVSLAHIGLAVMGEGDVVFRGERMSAKRALELAGLEPLVLGCKEGLAIVSSNAMAAGMAALVLEDCERLMDAADLIYALALEGYGGNVSPLDPACYARRPVPGPTQTAARVRRYLEGSFLWKGGVAATMQDPLCFRSACHVHGAVRDAISYLKPHLLLHINATDDNPCVLAEERRFAHNSNFEVTSWVLGFEMLGQALSHLARNICYQVIKMDSNGFSRLPRFLSPDGTSVMAYTTNQKTFSALEAEIRHLSNPVSVDYMALSGEVEDHASNAPLVVRKTARILDNLRYMLGMEAYHAAQAVDLRGLAPLGAVTARAYEAVRAVIPFLEHDRVISADIERGYDLMASGRMSEIARDMTGV
ncbi:HAL/PAL/TAL family ammonia-lyase [Mailhella massiliensis]|uniref:HAL/PAL/TAL family ammonia-lyase n=1 Tax=Mailhella massiliensis TaxID=1903261 RepID=UPI00097D1ADC|nr:aromatic amino acid ammonia-lyase [Mailhella massiliensis]